MRGAAIGLALALSATSAEAQIRPQPISGDGRMQVVDYHRNHVVEIEGAPGYQVLIALAPDEQIENVAVGDSNAWQIATSQSGNMLFVRPAVAGVATNMTVITSARFYAFDLVPALRGMPTAYEVRFRYPSEAKRNLFGTQMDLNEQIGQYRLSGVRSLRPRQVSDDGTKTYIDWAEDTPLPAVFIIDENGTERLANGNMRGDFYVIDSVHERLIFRIDKKTALAKRRPVKDAAP